ncbi:uncharacterized protein LOC115042604 isoform X2 [Echeneis naucrates]|uniref:uncharacterized protein LOC115042604 isoform X2 n=1 Tax=Echeneis naucrates TaxID=173247 RepID=UPI001113F561|nr:uncharacterized protein LOC115042604 isoform X2 [Echeneis naucrates]
MGSRIRALMRDDGPLILDGGLATELEAQGADLQGDPLWSARLLHTHPQTIRDAHFRFLLSGADVVTTATYQASIAGFTTHLDVSSECARELLISGVHLAKEAVERFVSDCRPTGQRRPLVAGSIGPYGAFLHNGSEYTGAYAEQMSIELKAWHRPQLHCLTAAGADLIAFETIPSLKEAEALVELLREFPSSEAWLSFSCKDGRCVSDGSRFTDAVQMAKKCSQLVAIGVNCCSPALVEPLLDSAVSLLCPDMSWVVYPNSGEEWHTERGWLPSARASASILELSCKWREQGAALIGGCCRVGPTQITELQQHFKGSRTSSASAV